MAALLGRRSAQFGPTGHGGTARAVPPAWQFLLFSLLLHVWLIALFGDTGGGRGDAPGWASTFSARLQATKPGAERIPAAGSANEAARTSTQPARSASTPSNQPADSPLDPSGSVSETRVETSLPPLPDVAKIPSLARESTAEVAPLAPISVAPIAAVPLAPGAPSEQAVSAAVPLVAPLTVEPLAVPKPNATFSIAAPTVSERPLVAPAPTTRIEVAPLPPLPSIAATPSVEAAPTAVPPMVIAPISLPPLTIPSGEPNPRTGAVSQSALPVAPLALRALEVPSAAAPAPNNLLVPALPIQPVEVPLSTRAPVTLPSIDIPLAKPTPTPAPSAAAAPSLPETQSGSDVTVQHAAAGTPSAPPTAPNNATLPDASRGSGAGPPALLNAPALPPAATPNARPLDLDALRRQARELSRDGAGARALLPFPALPKEASKRDIEKAFDKALKRPDCNEAYRDMGLAAVIPLVRDALRDDGCRWQNTGPSQPERTPSR